jgi:putative restriction endonuclease
MAEELPEFDAPVFKRLARNDTGWAAGHQSGIVIPKDLEEYFPKFPAGTRDSPAVDFCVRAILKVPGKGTRMVNTCYQRQTWGGTRNPISRLTGNLGFLRDAAGAGDYLLIERGLKDRDLLRLTLVSAGTAEHKRLAAKLGSQRWGPVQTGRS